MNSATPPRRLSLLALLAVIFCVCICTVSGSSHGEAPVCPEVPEFQNGSQACPSAQGTILQEGEWERETDETHDALLRKRRIPTVALKPLWCSVATPPEWGSAAPEQSKQKPK